MTTLIPPVPEAPMHTTDFLLRKIQAGDDSAKASLISRVLPAFNRWARGRVPLRCRAVVDTSDLVQTSIVRAVARMDQFESRHPGAFFAYLRQIMLNEVKELLKRESRVGETADMDEAEMPVQDALAVSVGRDNLIAYEQALATLSVEHQALVVMRFELGMSFVEMAAELEEPADNVRIRLARALKKMASYMES